jgi:hypothetical protein
MKGRIDLTLVPLRTRACRRESGGRLFEITKFLVETMQHIVPATAGLCRSYVLKIGSLSTGTTAGGPRFEGVTPMTPSEPESTEE